MEKKEILILDIETTGFLPKGSIVEIGIAELNLLTGEIKGVYDSLCREQVLTPEHYARIEAMNKGEEPPKSSLGWIFENSNLTVKEVLNAPDAEIVFRQVQEILNKYPLGCTAYNNQFDFKFLRDRGLEIKGLPCPMKLSTNVCKLPGRFNSYKWPTVEEAYNYFFPNNKYIEAHRGFDDAMHEAEIVFELYKRGIFKID